MVQLEQDTFPVEHKQIRILGQYPVHVANLSKVGKLGVGLIRGNNA